MTHTSFISRYDTTNSSRRGIVPPLLDTTSALAHMGEIRGPRDKNDIAVGTAILAKKLIEAEPQIDEHGLRYLINGSMSRNLLLVSAGLIDFVRPIGDIDIIIVGKKLREALAGLDGRVDELTELYPRFYFDKLSYHERIAINPQIWMHDKEGACIVIDRKEDENTDSYKIEFGKHKIYVVAPWILLANHVNHVLGEQDYGTYSYSEFQILLALMLRMFDYPTTVQLVARTVMRSDEDLPIIERQGAIKTFLSDVVGAMQLSERSAVSS